MAPTGLPGGGPSGGGTGHGSCPHWLRRRLLSNGTSPQECCGSAAAHSQRRPDERPDQFRTQRPGTSGGPRSSATAKGDAPSGLGQSAVGIYLAASLAADGIFVVAESVVLASPVSALEGGFPRSARPAQGLRVHARPSERYRSARETSRWQFRMLRSPPT